MSNFKRKLRNFLIIVVVSLFSITFCFIFLLYQLLNTPRRFEYIGRAECASANCYDHIDVYHVDYGGSSGERIEAYFKENNILKREFKLKDLPYPGLPCSVDTPHGCREKPQSFTLENGKLTWYGKYLGNYPEFDSKQ